MIQILPTRTANTNTGTWSKVLCGQSFFVVVEYQFFPCLIQEYAKQACSKTHPCGHPCGGVKNEETCLPCLHGCDKSTGCLKQDADDMCMICFTEALSAAPAVQVTKYKSFQCKSLTSDCSVIMFTSCLLFLFFKPSWSALMCSTFSALVVFWKIAGSGLELRLGSCCVQFVRYSTLWAMTDERGFVYIIYNVSLFNIKAHFCQI